MRIRPLFPSTFPLAWSGLEPAAADLGGMLRTFLGPDSASFPPLHVESGESGIALRALLPGWSADELELSVEEDRLTLKGTPAAVGEGAPRFGARDRESFSRTLRLPFRPDPESLEARLIHGELFLSLPGPAQERPARIPIQTSSN